MIPGKYNIVCPQGSTLDDLVFTYSINAVVQNLSGYSARMQVREKHTSTTVILSLSSDAGTLVLGGAAGTITFNISSSTTAALTPKEYVYDLEIVNPSSKPYRLVEGKFIVTPEVTR